MDWPGVGVGPIDQRSGRRDFRSGRIEVPGPVVGCVMAALAALLVFFAAQLLRRLRQHLVVVSRSCGRGRV